MQSTKEQTSEQESLNELLGSAKEDLITIKEQQPERFRAVKEMLTKIADGETDPVPNTEYQDKIPTGYYRYQFGEAHLLEQLHFQLTTFGLAMERVGSDGWDPLAFEEAAALSTQWNTLGHNIRIVMEMLKYADNILRGREYDPSENGRYLWYNSIDGILSKMERDSPYS